MLILIIVPTYSYSFQLASLNFPESPQKVCLLAKHVLSLNSDYPRILFLRLPIAMFFLVAVTFAESEIRPRRPVSHYHYCEVLKMEFYFSGSQLPSHNSEDVLKYPVPSCSQNFCRKRYKIFPVSCLQTPQMRESLSLL